MSVAIVAGTLVAVTYAGIFHFLGPGPFALAIVVGLELGRYLIRREPGPGEGKREDERSSRSGDDAA